jgi:hypothetical protein
LGRIEITTAITFAALMAVLWAVGDDLTKQDGQDGGQAVTDTNVMQDVIGEGAVATDT